LDTSHFSARFVQITMVEITEMKPEQVFARTVASWVMTRRVDSSSRRRKLKMTMPVILAVTLTNKTASHKMRFSQRL
jgi:hypothetical protein